MSTDRFCSPCHEVKGQRVTSLYGYCTVCENYLCTSCKEMHDHFPATRNHKILTASELSTKAKTPSGSKLGSVHNDNPQTESTVPEIKPKVSTASKRMATAPECSDSDAIKTASEALSATHISSPDSSVPESASVLDKINMKYTKFASFSAKIKDDKKECWITGIAVTKTGDVVLADNLNEKLKVFNKQRIFVSALSLPAEPWDVCLINDNEAVVSVPENEQVLIVDISGRKPRIKQTLELKYRVYGVTACRDSIIVACPYTSPPSVKLIDRTGKTKWSVDSYEGQQLLTRPWYVLVTMVNSPTPSKGPTRTVVVTDCDFHLKNPRLVVLDAIKGTVIGYRNLQDRNPYGIAADESKSDFIYICNSANELMIMTTDLTEEKVVLTAEEGITGTPQALGFDQSRGILILSNSNKTRSYLDCFQQYK